MSSDSWYQCHGTKCATCPPLYKCQDKACVQCSYDTDLGCTKGSCGDPNPCTSPPVDEWHLCNPDGSCSPCPTDLFKCQDKQCVSCTYQDLGCEKGSCPTSTCPQPTPTPTTYNCTETGCVKVQGDTGKYKTPDQCNTACIQYYQCNQTSCSTKFSDSGTPSGFNKGKCPEDHQCTPFYDCNGTTCKDTYDIPGSKHDGRGTCEDIGDDDCGGTPTQKWYYKCQYGKSPSDACIETQATAPPTTEYSLGKCPGDCTSYECSGEKTCKLSESGNIKQKDCGSCMAVYDCSDTSCTSTFDTSGDGHGGKGTCGTSETDNPCKKKQPTFRPSPYPIPTPTPEESKKKNWLSWLIAGLVLLFILILIILVWWYLRHNKKKRKSK